MRLVDQLAQMVAAKTTSPPVDPDVEAAAPNLWEMLTLDKWADGSDRILPQIIVERVPGGYKATLKDDSLCIRKSCMVSRLQDVPVAIERAIVDPDLPWESFKSYRNKGGPKVPDQTSTSKRRKR